MAILFISLGLTLAGFIAVRSRKLDAAFVAALWALVVLAVLVLPGLFFGNLGPSLTIILLGITIWRLFRALKKRPQ